MKRAAYISAAALLGAMLLYGAIVNGWLDFTLTTGTGNPASGYARFYVDSATNLATCLLSTGVSCLPNTPGSGSAAYPYPNVGSQGSLVATDFEGSNTSNILWTPGNNSGSSGCQATGWPIPGVFRNPSISTTAANGPLGIERGYLIVECLNNGINPSGSVFVPPGAAAGGFVGYNNTGFGWVHTVQQSQVNFGMQVNGSGTHPAVYSEAAEFVADNGQWTVLSNFITLGAFTASTTAYLSLIAATAAGQNQNTTTESLATVPIPYASTAQYFVLCPLSTGPATNPWTATVRAAGSSTAITVTVPASSAPPGCIFDTTHTGSIAADTAIDLQVVTGALTQGAVGFWALGITPASGTKSMIAGNFAAGTISTTPANNQPYARNTGSVAMPFACSASHLDVYQQSANGATVTTTFTLLKNGSATAITGTINQASGTGVIVVDNIHSASYAPGDTMALQDVTNTGTSGQMTGWSLICQ